MTHKGATTISALVSDIESLNDLLETDREAPEAAPPQETQKAPPQHTPALIKEPDTQGNTTTIDDPAPKKRGEPDNVPEAAPTNRFRRSRTLPSRDSAPNPEPEPGPDPEQKPATADETTPRPPQDTAQPAEPVTAPQSPEWAQPPTGYAKIIAEAWKSLPEETHIPRKVADEIILKIAYEIAQAAGHPLEEHHTDHIATSDIGKGFTIGPAWPAGGLTISRTTPQGIRTGYLAALTNSQQGTGVRDPQFPTHILWWNPEDGPKRLWLENTLRANAARFITDCQ